MVGKLYFTGQICIVVIKCHNWQPLRGGGDILRGSHGALCIGPGKSWRVRRCRARRKQEAAKAVFLFSSNTIDRYAGTVTTQGKPDKVYAQQREVIERFSFDQQVVSVFPDMIRRSVPGYDSIIEMTGILSARYAQPRTRLYDLGCSLGASSLAMAQLVDQPGCEVISIDNSEAMISRARALVETGSLRTPISFQLADVLDVSLQNASVTVMNFTLQFIENTQRDALIQRIADALCDGGILILSEKIHFDDPEEEDLQQTLHHAFKYNNGYSQLEISQKRTALEDVLVPETLDKHKRRLLGAGFKKVHVWFHCFNFISLVAWK